MGIGAPVQKARDFRGSLIRLVKLLAPRRAAILAAFALAVAGTVFGIAGPKIMGRAMDLVKDAFIARVKKEIDSRAC
jgi:ATP-binding cassette subfamily B protein